MDRVEVAGRSGVTHQVGAHDRERSSGQFVAGLDVGVAHQCGHAAEPSSGARATRVEYALQTTSPAASTRSPRVLMMSLPPIDLMRSTVTTTLSSSPATIGRW